MKLDQACAEVRDALECSSAPAPCALICNHAHAPAQGSGGPCAADGAALQILADDDIAEAIKKVFQGAGWRMLIARVHNWLRPQGECIMLLEGPLVIN